MMVNLVTGATGFLGKELVSFLSSSLSDESLFTCALNGSALSKNHESIDLTQTAKVRAMIHRIKPQRIYHLAGIAQVSQDIPFQDYFFQNTLSTQNLLEAIADLNSPCDFFLTSSVHVYGNQTGVVSERSEIKPEGAYGFTKYLAEETLKNFVLKHPHIRGVVGRLYSCIGPNQPLGFATSDICLKVKKAKISSATHLEVGPVTTTRQFTDVRDVVRTFPALLESQLSSRFEIFNIANNKQITIKELIETIIQLEGLSLKIKSQDNHQNPFQGLKVETTKLSRFIPLASFRSLESSLKDILAKTHG
ncbi:MAG: NAD-dependent epimerase/dehydratase family protein [Deltaproteobacteria bacterium]